MSGGQWATNDLAVFIRLEPRKPLILAVMRVAEFPCAERRRKWPIRLGSRHPHGPRHEDDQIPIEERNPAEVTHHGGKQLTPHGVGICNPAFDVTPARYVTAIITERGVLRAPYSESLAAMELVTR